MKGRIIAALVCIITALTLIGCVSTPVNVNVENNNTISGNILGVSALVKIGNGLWYDTTTRIVYWWNSELSINGRRWDTTPSPYYAPNGLPYRYNPETNTFEEITYDA